MQHNEFGEGNGLELADYGARLYDSQIGRWWAVDPLADKYASITPYNYCNNNPSNAIDFDGKDIIVLNAPNAVRGLGHAPVLIGNNDNGWQFYSKNGTRPIPSSGPSNNHPEKGLKFDTFNDFKENYLDSKNNINPKTGEAIYTKGFQIKTSDVTDLSMKNAAKKQVEEWYDVSGKINGSCIDVCKDALKAGGLNPGTIDLTFGFIPFAVVQATRNSIPNEVYKGIVAGNKGIDISNDLIPSKSENDVNVTVKNKQ